MTTRLERRLRWLNGGDLYDDEEAERGATDVADAPDSASDDAPEGARATDESER